MNWPLESLRKCFSEIFHPRMESHLALREHQRSSLPRLEQCSDIVRHQDSQHSFPRVGALLGSGIVRHQHSNGFPSETGLRPNPSRCKMHSVARWIGKSIHIAIQISWLTMPVLWRLPRDNKQVVMTGETNHDLYREPSSSRCIFSASV